MSNETLAPAIQEAQNLPKNAPITTPSQAIAGAKDRFLSVMPQERYIREANFALQIILNNPSGFKNVDLISIRTAVENIAFTGLTLNPVMKLAYLIPRKGKAILEPSWMGLTKILTDSGSVKKLSAVVVYEDEEFNYDPATRMVTKHEQKYAQTEAENLKRKIKGAYSCAMLADGSMDYEFMPEWELQKIKSKSDGSGSSYSPWQENNWANEMRKKSVIKRHYKSLPKSEQVSKAIDLDDAQFIESTEVNLSDLTATNDDDSKNHNTPDSPASIDITPSQPISDKANTMSDAELEAEIQRQDEERNKKGYSGNHVMNKGSLFETGQSTKKNVEK